MLDGHTTSRHLLHPLHIFLETTWQPGNIIHTRWQFDLLPEVPPGKYHFELVLADDTTVTLPFGKLLVSEE